MEFKYPHFFMRGDNADSYFSLYAYSNRCIFEGKFPLYCFNEFCGQRYFATGQTGLLNPLILLAMLLSKIFIGKYDLMIDILAYFSIVIGCAGSFFLLKKLNCSDISAIIGSIAWNFNCYNIWQGTGWIIVIYTTSVFPFFLLTSMLLLEKASLPNIIFAIIPRVYLFYLGHPQFFIFAAVFDCIFTFNLCLLNSSNNKLFSLFSMIRNYLIVYISTTFLSLPLLIPEYLYTQMSYGYGSERTVADLLNQMKFESPAFTFPFLYSEDSHITFYPPYVGILLFVFLLVGLFLPLLLLKRSIKAEIKNLVLVILSATPCLALGYFLLFNSNVLKLLLFFPILNRFQYYHRISIYYAAFEVIVSCLSFTVICNLFHTRIKDIFTWNKLSVFIKYTILIVETLSFILLYTITPHIGRGVLFDTSKLYDYSFAEQLTGGRYVTIGFYNDYYYVNKNNYDISESVDYNLNKLYGINNISGYKYDCISKEVYINNECFKHMKDYSGSIHELYPGMIEQMREQSVCWYIVKPECKDVFDSFTSEYGIDFVSETKCSLIYYDSYAQPYAYDDNENAVEISQDVNSLILHTDNNFPGGKITVNYTYDTNFNCYIDGKPTSLTNEPENWQFYAVCEPGEHEIIIRYEDNILNACCVITASYIAISSLGIVIYKQIRKRRQYQQI